MTEGSLGSGRRWCKHEVGSVIYTWRTVYFRHLRTRVHLKVTDWKLGGGSVTVVTRSEPVSCVPWPARVKLAAEFLWSRSVSARSASREYFYFCQSPTCIVVVVVGAIKGNTSGGRGRAGRCPSEPWLTRPPPGVISAREDDSIAWGRPPSMGVDQDTATQSPPERDDISRRPAVDTLDSSNHGRLTAAAARHAGPRLCGWSVMGRWSVGRSEVKEARITLGQDRSELHMRY